jgi:hypothetical protein
MDSLQRIDSWYLERQGKFTARESYKLMGVKGLGETGKTYAIEKAIEQLFGSTQDDYISYDMQRGIDLEPLAFAKFADLKSLDFINVFTCGFMSKDENSGSSPDGLTTDRAVLEIKCPKVDTFMKLVVSNEINKNYFYQMQKQIDDTDSDKAYFFNYCVIDGVEYYHEIVVNRCQTTIDLINERIKEAVEIKNEFIKQLNKNKQWK